MMAGALASLASLGCASSGTAAGTEGGGGAGGCPNDLPESCPSPEPSFAADVAPVLQERCAPCHSPGGLAAERPLTSYASVHALRSPVLNQVYGCNMPPSTAEPLAAGERDVLLAWLVCGAKDN